MEALSFPELWKPINNPETINTQRRTIFFRQDLKHFSQKKFFFLISDLSEANPRRIENPQRKFNTCTPKMDLLKVKSLLNLIRSLKKF